MIREIIGAETVSSLLTHKHRKKGMSNTMLGVVGTAVGVGAYMAYKTMKKNNQ